MEHSNNLIWMDLEMTGLNPEKDVIVEIATIITDNHLNELEEGPSLVIHHSQETFNRMVDVVTDMHTKSGLITKSLESTISTQEAEKQTLDFIQRFCDVRTTPLCGNSIYNDRNFLKNHMPNITNFLHYRVIDVSSVKELVHRWYPNDEHAHFPKKSNHRALDDVRASIAELKHYRKYFFI